MAMNRSFPILIDGRIGAKAYLDQEQLSIGQDPGCDICIADPFLAPKHAEIRLVNRLWYVCNVSGSGIMTVDGQQFPPGAWVPLRNGAEICLSGATRLMYSDTDVEMITALLPRRQLMNATAMPVQLSTASGKTAPPEHPLEEQETEIGKSKKLKLRREKKLKPGRERKKISLKPGLIILCVLFVLLSAAAGVFFYLRGRNAEQTVSESDSYQESESDAGSETEPDSEQEAEPGSEQEAEPDEVTVIESEIDGAISMLNNHQLYDFKCEYDRIVEAYQLLTADQQSRVKNYKDLQSAYGRWFSEMRQGILGIFAEILQSDFNPSWNVTFEELLNNYNGVSPVDASAKNYGSLYYTEITLDNYNYGCICHLTDDKIDYYAIGDGSQSSSAELAIEGLMQYIEGTEYMEEKTNDYGATYHYQDGKTVFVCTGSNDLLEEKMIIVFPGEEYAPVSLYAISLLLKLELTLGYSAFHWG